MSEIMVVGSNSFSGANFVRHALNQGMEVTGISRSMEPHRAFLPYKWGDQAGRFKFHALDLNHDLKEIMTLVRDEKPKYVVNFAAQSMVAESWQYPADWMMTNVVSTVRFHDELRKCDFLKRYVHVSTPEVYGSCADFIREEHHFNPSTPYAVSRAAADMCLKTFFNAYHFPVVFTRAANVYGPGQQLYRIIPRTILFMLMGQKLELHGGGLSTRSFIHMDDVSRATWAIMERGENGQTYHISTPEIISIRELVACIAQKLGVNFDDHVTVVGERLGKDAAYLLDSTKLREKLGWSETINLDAGLNETIQWVRDYFEDLKTLPVHYTHKA